jgi:hypothetical protein
LHVPPQSVRRKDDIKRQTVSKELCPLAHRVGDGRKTVKKILLALIMLAMAAGASLAKDKTYQQCTIISMSVVPCGSHRGVGWQRSNDLLCQEYVIRTADMEYHIRQPKEKHAAVLPIGAHAEFLVDKDEIKLRLDGKKREFLISSVSALGPEPK